MKSIIEMDNLELATQYTAITEEAIKRSLITDGYHQNAKSLTRHIGRRVMKQAKVELDKGTVN